MCNIIYVSKDEGVPLESQTKATLLLMHNLSYAKNSHGAGHYNSFGTKLLSNKVFDPFLLDNSTEWDLTHYRLATKGEKDYNNMQPFELTRKIGLKEAATFVVAHNGTIEGEFDGSDSLALAEDLADTVVKKLEEEDLDTPSIEAKVLDKAVALAVQEVIEKKKGSMSVFFFVRINEGYWHKYYWRNKDRTMYLRENSKEFSMVMSTDKYAIVSDTVDKYLGEWKPVEADKLFAIQITSLKPIATLKFPEPPLLSWRKGSWKGLEYEMKWPTRYGKATNHSDTKAEKDKAVEQMRVLKVYHSETDLYADGGYITFIEGVLKDNTHVYVKKSFVNPRDARSTGHTSVFVIDNDTEYYVMDTSPPIFKELAFVKDQKAAKEVSRKVMEVHSTVKNLSFANFKGLYSLQGLIEEFGGGRDSDPYVLDEIELLTKQEFLDELEREQELTRNFYEAFISDEDDDAIYYY